MTVQIFEFEQGTAEWRSARMGIPTGSEFATVLAKGKKGEDSKTRATYMRKLAGEIISGLPMESYTNRHMERGKLFEDTAREAWQFINGGTLKRVGFVRNGMMGCSPDSLIDGDGVLEIKTALPHILVEHLDADVFPSEHVPQCQGALLVTGRRYVEIGIFGVATEGDGAVAAGMPMFTKRAERDEAYIANLMREIDKFNDELGALVTRIAGRYGLSLERLAA